MVIGADEYPLHQVPLSLEFPASSDRNSYDRYYFNAHDRTGALFFVTGHGIYPNLGTTDAFVSIARNKRHLTIRLSDALGNDRLNPAVGPYRIEVIEPLERLRVSMSETEGVAFDLGWTGAFPAIDEPSHVLRQGGKVILDAMRFAQLGTWEGQITIDGDRYEVTPDIWLGTRDRSWGIRPSGAAEPAGRWADEPDDRFGFYWVYMPLLFEDHAVIVILQEDGDGTRTLNAATRVWSKESGRAPEQLGWPQVEVTYQSGTRIPERAVVTAHERDGTPLRYKVDCRGWLALNCGGGYGGDWTWNHGQWKGRDFVERYEVDCNDPNMAAMATFGVVEHIARVTCNGQEGFGMFEHGTFGRHDPSGFADLSSTAP